jgi:hypothetical protein
MYIYFLKICCLTKCFFTSFRLLSLNFHAVLHREVPYVCALTDHLCYHGRLLESTIKIFIIQDCPFSLFVNGKRVTSMSSFKDFSEHFAYTCFNQFSSAISMLFVFSFYHTLSSHSFMLFGLPTIKRSHMKSVYQFKITFI